jgi:uncharacterized protein
MNQDYDQVLKYTCQKCGNKQYEIGEIWTISSFWTRLFEYYNRRFTYITCQRCKYTEFFKVPKKKIGEAFNFVTR